MIRLRSFATHCQASAPCHHRNCITTVDVEAAAGLDNNRGQYS
jgi:hypothetical protein